MEALILLGLTPIWQVVDLTLPHTSRREKHERENYANLIINKSCYSGWSKFNKEGLVYSFELVNIVMELEEAFEIEIAAEEVIAENFENMDAITAMVEKSTS